MNYYDLSLICSFVDDLFPNLVSLILGFVDTLHAEATYSKLILYHETDIMKFIDAFPDRVLWGMLTLCKYSSNFYRKYASKLMIGNLCDNYGVLPEFMAEHGLWYGLSCNPKLTIDLLRKYKSKIDWNAFAFHFTATTKVAKEFGLVGLIKINDELTTDFIPNENLILMDKSSWQYSLMKYDPEFFRSYDFKMSDRDFHFYTENTKDEYMDWQRIYNEYPFTFKFFIQNIDKFNQQKGRCPHIPYQLFLNFLWYLD